MTNVQHLTEIAVPDVRFDLPAPEYAEHKWVLFDEHAPSAQTPLLNDGPFGAHGPASRRKTGVPRMIRINGFTYMRGDIDMTTPFAAASPSSRRATSCVCGARSGCLRSKVVALAGELRPGAVQPGEWAATLEHQASEFRRVFLAVHMLRGRPRRGDGASFRKRVPESCSVGREATARAMLQGFPNASLDRASMLWDLSRTAAQRHNAASGNRGRHRPRCQ